MLWQSIVAILVQVTLKLPLRLTAFHTLILSASGYSFILPLPRLSLYSDFPNQIDHTFFRLNEINSALGS
jgi:hypothetical protein